MLAALAFSAFALAGCSADVSVDKTVSQSELEKKVAGMYTPDDPDATVDASCDGELKADVGETQDCHLEVGQESADVRVEVTSVEGSDTKFDATPFVPADRVADTIKKSLADQGYQVDSVECEGELMGELDETVACTASPATGEGKIEAQVTEVRGLMVNFNYKVVS